MYYYLILYASYTQIHSAFITTKLKLQRFLEMEFLDLDVAAETKLPQQISYTTLPEKSRNLIQEELNTIYFNVIQLHYRETYHAFKM